jgi:antitoxin (DNA-binding transcriptional repressor) of toxin-antitoxin stability system
MEIRVSIEEAQARLLELIEQTAPHTEIIITDKHKPVAKLVIEPRKPSQRRQPGLGKGFITSVSDDDEPGTDLDPQPLLESTRRITANHALGPPSLGTKSVRRVCPTGEVGGDEANSRSILVLRCLFPASRRGRLGLYGRTVLVAFIPQGGECPLTADRLLANWMRGLATEHGKNDGERKR